MNLQSMINTRLGVGLGFLLGKYLPISLAYLLVDFMARYLAWRKNLSLVKTVYNNQRVVYGEKLTSQELRQAVKKVFTYAGQGFIDLYRNFQNPAALQKKIYKNGDFDKLIKLSKGNGTGAFIVAPHMSSFDLMLMAAAFNGLKATVLTCGKPTSGYKFQNNIRALSGLDVMPMSAMSQQKVISIMRDGGIIITAVDRPMPEQRHKLIFFDKPSPLPIGYVYMAKRANVPVVIVSVHKNGDGLYELKMSDPITMVSRENAKQEVIHNAQVVLNKIEEHIRAHPLQWQMYYPVWPDGHKE